MSTLSTTPARFDDTERLNDDGSVTLRIIPSNWRRYNVSPDTYQLVNGDSWCEREVEYWSEETGRDLGYDDIEWTYDHTGIVRAFAETLALWIRDTLMGAGLASVRDVEVLDSWSPREYNFTSDGFEVSLTCDPQELRGLTPDFDVDDWGHEWYRSVDGFASFVTSRLRDDSWHADYDGEFRIESLLSGLDISDDETWRFALYDDEDEVYRDHTQVEVKHPIFMDSGYTLPELEEWADSLLPTQPETLLDLLT